MNKELAKRIKIARGRMSQTAFAKAVGVSRGAVGQWEIAKTGPTNENLRKIAQLRGLAFEWLATGRGPKGCDAWVTNVAWGEEPDADRVFLIRHGPKHISLEIAAPGARALSPLDRRQALRAAVEELREFLLSP